MEIALPLFFSVAIISLACEYMDASIGMGYGTTLTPLLLIIGFAPLQVVPAVLLGQLVGGLIGGFFHHKLGNVSLDFRQDLAIKKRLRGLGYLPRSTDSKVVFILVICGIIGALVAVIFAINVSTFVLQTYIGVMVLGIGIVILIRRNREMRFSWSGLVAVGLISAFNKGSSGGGYGPLVTAGQMVSGRETRGSIGSTTLAEGVVCITPFLSYLFMRGNIYWLLAAATSIGSIVAAPLAALTVKKLPPRNLKLVVGIVTCVLGVVTLGKTLLFK